MNDRILEHVIQTIDNRKLIQKAISKKMNLDRFLEEANQTEEIERQLDVMKTEEEKKIRKISHEEKSERKRSVWRRQDYAKQKTDTTTRCSYCGLTGKHPPGQGCPAYGKTCHKCGIKNHFESVCTTKIEDRKKKSRRVKCAKEDDYDSQEKTSSNDEYFARHLVVLKVKDKKNEKTLNVKINDIEVHMEPDSGAEVNLMDEHQFKSLKKRATEEIELKPRKIRLKMIQGALTTKG